MAWPFYVPTLVWYFIKEAFHRSFKEVKVQKALLYREESCLSALWPSMEAEWGCVTWTWNTSEQSHSEGALNTFQHEMCSIYFQNTKHTALKSLHLTKTKLLFFPNIYLPSLLLAPFSLQARVNPECNRWQKIFLRLQTAAELHLCLCEISKLGKKCYI